MRTITQEFHRRNAEIMSGYWQARRAPDAAQHEQ
jgi:hypothetical protein